MQQSLARVALLVRDYDEALAWYTGVLGFECLEDAPREAGKRWVVVAPRGARESALLLARAATPEQAAFVGNQSGGRVWLFLHTDDFARDHAALLARGVRFLEEPRHEAYGTVAVFVDLYGNKWDLLEPREGATGSAVPPPAARLERYLHEHIPVSRHLGVRVLAAESAGIRLGAPLAPNLNHRLTAFGGSLSAVAILAAWSWLHHALGGEGPARRIVIQSNSIEYLAAADGDFEAYCRAPAPERWALFERTLARRQRARLALDVELTVAERLVAQFHGQYVVLLAPAA